VKDKDGKVVRHGLAYSDPSGNLYWSGTTEAVADSKPEGGSIDKMSVVGARSPGAVYAQKLQEENPSLTASELAAALAGFRHLQSVETALGGGIMGRNVVALNTVADHILRVEEYAKALQNGQIPRANQIANAVARETGKPEITTFNAGRDIMADEIVRLLTSTGGTESDRVGMQSRISDMFSPEQFSGVFEVLRDMSGARFVAIEQWYAGNDPARRKHFEEEVLTDAGRQAFASLTRPGGKGAAPAGGTTPPPGSLPPPASSKPPLEDFFR
jgi:hypothetical protein